MSENVPSDMCIRAVCSEYSLSARRNFASLAIQNALREDYGQTAYAQADHNLRWAHMSFSHVATQICITVYT